MAIDRSADELVAFVDRVRSQTGAAKVSLVGHSQGGIVPRYIAKYRNRLSVIDDIVGLAPSSHGTVNPGAVAAGAFGCVACLEQLAGSSFMRRLNTAPEAPEPISYTVPTTRYDEVVIPQQSQFLRGPTVTNVLLQDRCPADVAEHVGIQYDPVALEWTLNALGRPGPADPSFVPTCGALLQRPAAATERAARLWRAQ